MSDDRLVEEAQNNIKASRIGAAQAELMRRNTEALRENARKSAKQNDIILAFTFLLFLIAVMQLAVTLQSWDTNRYVILFISIVIFATLYKYMKELFDWVDDRYREE